jgi:trimethylamine---corrinoid protein Co-methyltransferase
MHSAGWLEAGLTASFEKFILDVESLAVFHDFFIGFEINTETLALDMIAQVGPGGHNLGTPHTKQRFRHAFYESTIHTRQNNKSWLDAGGLDATQRAYVIWKQWLMEYTPPTLDPAIREAVEDYVARRSKELENVELYND